MNPRIQKILTLAALSVGFLFAAKYLLPLLFPFLLGFLLALASEPLVAFLSARLRLRRGIAAGIGVSMSLSFVVFLLLLLCALLVRELRVLAGILPEMEQTLRGGMSALSAWLLSLIEHTPEGIRNLLTRNVTDFFSDSSALLGRVTSWLLQLASGFLSHMPDRALGFATAVISGFMFSAKLPTIRAGIRNRLNIAKLRPFLDALRGLKTALWGWLKAQLTLSGVTFLVATAGFFLLRIPYAPLWAALIAVVDALPILGTGAALVPWSLISFLQGDRVQAFGLLGLYAAAALLRSVLEPKLVGRQLGLDPLVTLGALYIGFRLFGIPGLLLAPVLAVTAAQLAAAFPDASPGSPGL